MYFVVKFYTVGSTEKTHKSLQACGDDIRLPRIEDAVVCEAGNGHKI